MPIQGEIKTLYKNKNNTSPIFPTTKVKAVSDENGIGLDALLRNNYATKTYVTNEIAKAQVGGDGSEIDLSGFATKDDVANIKHPISSVNNKTGAVVLTAEDVGARPNTWMPSAEQVGAHPNTWLPTLAQIKAAPAGFGLGGQATNIGGDLNEIVVNGWYCYNSGTCTNVPEDKASLLFVECFYNTNYCKQTVTIISTGKVYIRTRNNGNWSEWNPGHVANRAAPSGYGLGEVTPQRVSSADEAIATGWYQVADPTASSGYGWLYCSSYSANYKRQEFYNTKNATAYIHVVRYMYNGVWQEWEWVNPPMELGTEYRTTERYGGNPVYVKKVNAGLMPSAGYTSISLSELGIPSIPFNVTAWIISDVEGYRAMPNKEDSYVIALNALTIASTETNASNRTAYFNLKYTKD